MGVYCRAVVAEIVVAVAIKAVVEVGRGCRDGGRCAYVVENVVLAAELEVDAVVAAEMAEPNNVVKCQ